MISQLDFFISGWIQGDSYGANGSAAGEDALWNDAANINARIADGVVSISQYNPKSEWGSRIAAIRAQLNTPKFKP
ncbi:MAG: hypothetical protein ABUL62_15020 [Myxococcales bacterium]